MAVLNVISYPLINRYLIRSVATWGIVSALLLAESTILPAQPPPSREYQIKAVFLFNFAQFVEWPAHAFPEAETPLVIGVLGRDPFGTYLEEIVRGEKINGHPLVIQRYSAVTEAKNCHILFINFTKTDDLKRAFTYLKSRSTLMVGDAPNFIQQGGMIRFFTENSKTRIQVNLETVKGAELAISSKLLRLADVVSPSTN
jgi:hypothetical protein